MQQKITYFVESEKDMKKKKTGERDRKCNDKDFTVTGRGNVLYHSLYLSTCLRH